VLREALAPTLEEVVRAPDRRVTLVPAAGEIGDAREKDERVLRTGWMTTKAAPHHLSVITTAASRGIGPPADAEPGSGSSTRPGPSALIEAVRLSRTGSSRSGLVFFVGSTEARALSDRYPGRG